MEYYAGLDVSVKETSVCIIDGTGRIVREVKVPTEPEAILAVFAGEPFSIKRIGLEAGPLSQWLHVGSSRIRRGSAGNATCEGSAFADDSEDGSQGCTGDCPVDPDGMVRAGSRWPARRDGAHGAV